MDRSKTLADLRALLDALKTLLHPGSHGLVADLVTHGEPKVAVEMLCEHLSELGVVLEAPAYSQLMKLSSELGLDERYRSMVPAPRQGPGGSDLECREALLTLLHLALVDIRASAAEGRAGPAFGLADLFHTVPLELMRTGDPLEVLAGVWRRAEQKGVQEWVRNALETQSRLQPALLERVMKPGQD